MRVVRPTLIALTTVVRNKAQRLSFLNLFLYFISLVLCAGAVVPNVTLAWVLVVLAFFFKVASVVVAANAERLHGLSREAQRLALLEDSFGKASDPFRVVELRRRIGARFEDEATLVDYAQPYYRSGEQKGYRRLAANIQQSAFWSKHLLECYGRDLFICLIASATIVGTVVYILLVIGRDKNTIMVDPYLISLAALTFVMGLIDYVKLYIACQSSVALLNEVDRRLDKGNERNDESLLADFTDYSIATVTAPPVPYRIYLRHKEYLIALWSQRQQEKSLDETKFVVSGESGVVFEGVSSFGHMTKKQFESLVNDAAKSLAEQASRSMPIPVIVSVLRGFSGVPVFELKLYQDGVLWRQLVLRLHFPPQNAHKELLTVKRISRENADVIAYCPLEEPFVSQGALFYYHANIQTNDELYPIDEFVLRFLRESNQIDFSNYFSKLLQGLLSVVKVYEGIEDYTTISLAQALPTMLTLLPPMYILDLRSKHYDFSDGMLTVSQESCLPENKTAQIAHCSDMQRADEPVIMNLRILSVNASTTHMCAMDLALNEDTCRCLFDKEQLIVPYKKGDMLTVVMDSANRIQLLQDFLFARNGLHLEGFRPIDIVSDIMNTGDVGRQPLHLAFRHMDLHCDNCLVSRSNFKIVDVGDSKRGLICMDLARLEISLMSRLIEGLGLDAIAVENLCQLLDGEKGVRCCSTVRSIADIVTAIRTSFVSGFRIKPQEQEISIAYFLECCEQMQFSILSTMGLRGAASVIVKHWKQHLDRSINNERLKTRECYGG